MRLQTWSESNPTRESTGIKVSKKIVQQKSNTCIEVQSYRIDLFHRLSDLDGSGHCAASWCGFVEG